MMSFIISTRLDAKTLMMLDQVRGKTSRSLALKELATLGLRRRHQFRSAELHSSCHDCFATEDSVVHLSFQEQDQSAYQDLFYLHAAAEDKHEVG